MMVRKAADPSTQIGTFFNVLEGTFILPQRSQAGDGIPRAMVDSTRLRSTPIHSVQRERYFIYRHDRQRLAVVFNEELQIVEYLTIMPRGLNPEQSQGKN
jgi:hypothetical protein